MQSTDHRAHLKGVLRLGIQPPLVNGVNRKVEYEKRACCLLTTNPFLEAKKPHLEPIKLYHIVR